MGYRSIRNWSTNFQSSHSIYITHFSRVNGRIRPYGRKSNSSQSSTLQVDDTIQWNTNAGRVGFPYMSSLINYISHRFLTLNFSIYSFLLKPTKLNISPISVASMAVFDQIITNPTALNPQSSILQVDDTFQSTQNAVRAGYPQMSNMIKQTSYTDTFHLLIPSHQNPQTSTHHRSPVLQSTTENFHKTENFRLDQTRTKIRKQEMYYSLGAQRITSHHINRRVLTPEPTKH